MPVGNDLNISPCNCVEVNHCRHEDGYVTCSNDFLFSYYLSGIQKEILHYHVGFKEGYLAFIKTYLNKKLTVAGLLNYATETPELYLSCIP